MWITGLSVVVGYSFYMGSDYWQAFHYLLLVSVYLLIVYIIRKLRKQNVAPLSEDVSEVLFRYSFAVTFNAMCIMYAISRDRWGYAVDSYDDLVTAWHVIAVLFTLNIVTVAVNRFHSSSVTPLQMVNFKVCDKWLYKVVRHPSYLLMSLHFLVLPYLFGNLVGYYFSAVLVALYVYRTYKEDKRLQLMSSEYVEYTKRVKYRLIYGVW